MEIQKLQLQPGDVLVIRTARTHFKGLSEHWRAKLDEAGINNKVLIIAPEIELSVVSKAS